ncbi:hypothetical protein F5Y07DRAFT_189647 [Xylaria sp. FL0933]|nr:hypothetical protein F5Y07DRAFT_189647 [Xylaria sp. FL0933]
MAHASSSEDEFPDVEIIIQRRKHNPTSKDIKDYTQHTSRQPKSPRSTQTGINETVGKTPATAVRRRKLGQGQPVDHSLLKPWQGSEAKGVVCEQVSGSRQTSWSRTARKDAGTISAGELIDRLPVKTKCAEFRAVSSGTVFDSPPEERKRTRRLISRGEKKALELKISEREKISLTSSDESESDAGSCNTDEEPDFIPEGDSDSDDLLIPSPRLSQSPSGPRRVQRRVLSSSRKPALMKPVQDELLTSPKKQREKQNIVKESATRRLKTGPKGNLEDFFKQLKITYDESEPDEPASRTTKTPMLDPTTPRKDITSPAKVPRIPMSPWKPEHKEFWDPEVNFAWIDKHSPPKKSTKTLDLTAPDSKEELKRRYGTSPEKKQAKKAFDAVKEDLARDFLQELDSVITNGKLAQLTETTGGLRIVWSKTLQTTAGRAHWKCKTTTTTSKQPSTGTATATTTATTKKTTTTQHSASIELATKVLSNESDLLNTVAHEFCHLAVFLLHGKPRLAHGAEFKAYGQRVMRAASAATSTLSDNINNNSKDDNALKTLKTPRDRGVEINVTTRHSYEIEYRFVWRCADCGGEVHRHSRSVDPTRQRCGRCKLGVLVQVKPVPRGQGLSSSTTSTSTTASTTTTTKKGGAKKGGLEGSRDVEVGILGVVAAGAGVGVGVQKKPEKRKKTAYQEFTSREMKALSASHKGLSFGEKMALVSARWSEHNQKRLSSSSSSSSSATKSSSKTASPPLEAAAEKKEAVHSTAAVSVRGLAAAVERLEIEDHESG